MTGISKGNNVFYELHIRDSIYCEVSDRTEDQVKTYHINQIWNQVYNQIRLNIGSIISSQIKEDLNDKIRL